METPNPTQQKAAELTQARRKALAYQEVFGQPTRRSASQRIVIEDMREMCGRDRPIFQPDANGDFNPIRAAHIDGAQTQFLLIKRRLAQARKTTDEKPKVKVKRGASNEE